MNFHKTVLVTHYRATTNRMLRVAVNGFFESLGVVFDCMRELDVDAVARDWVGAFASNAEDNEGKEVRQLERVQGLEERDVIG